MRLLLAALLLTSAAASAQPEPDSSFADGGFARIVPNPAEGGSAHEVEVLPDGSTRVLSRTLGSDVIQAPYIAGLRLDGTVDTGFGANGIARITVEGIPMLSLTAMARLSDGRLLLAGSAVFDPSGLYAAIAVMRLPDGRPDTTFGNRGAVWLPNGTSSRAVHVVADGSSAYVLSQAYFPDVAAFRGAVTRLGRAGIDTAYGTGGTFTGPPETDFNDIRPLGDGRAIVVGQAGLGALFLGLTGRGDIDPVFGLVTRRMSFNRSTRALRIGPPGSRGYIVSGSTTLDSNGLYDTATVLWRVRGDNTLDPTFGTDGAAVFNVYDRTVSVNGSEAPTRPEFLEGGVVGLLVEGYGVNGFSILVVRGDGSPEPTNGPGGVGVVFADRAGLSAVSAAVLYDNAFVVAGTQERAGRYDAFVARAFVKSQPTAGESEPGSTVTRLDVAPNPLFASARITLALEAPATARVVVLDALGRTVAVLADGPLPAGETVLRLDAAGRPAGVYAVVATVGGQRTMRRVTVVR